MLKILTVLLTTFSFNVFAADVYVIFNKDKSYLLCEIFTEDKFFCEESEPAKPGVASNTLILTEQELINLKAKPLQVIHNDKG